MTQDLSFAALGWEVENVTLYDSGAASIIFGRVSSTGDIITASVYFCGNNTRSRPQYFAMVSRGEDVLTPGNYEDIGIRCRQERQVPEGFYRMNYDELSILLERLS